MKERLDTGLPTLFFLWEPHQLAAYQLHRIQLPTYRRDLFAAARVDYPYEVMEKVVSKRLTAIPRVLQLMTNFRLDSSDQESIMARTANLGISAFDASCEWLQSAANKAAWSAWLPDSRSNSTIGCPAVRAAEGMLTFFSIAASAVANLPELGWSSRRVVRASPISLALAGVPSGRHAVLVSLWREARRLCRYDLPDRVPTC